MDTPRSESGTPRPSRMARFAAMAGDEAKARVEQGAGFAAGTLADIADAIHIAGEQLKSRERHMGARLAGQAALAVAGLSHSLSDRSAEDMINSVREFGRRRPATFIAVSALAGFAIGRVATASRQSEPESDEAARRAASSFRNGAPAPADFAPANQI